MSRRSLIALAITGTAVLGAIFGGLAVAGAFQTDTTSNGGLKANYLPALVFPSKGRALKRPRYHGYDSFSDRLGEAAIPFPGLYYRIYGSAVWRQWRRGWATLVYSGARADYHGGKIKFSEKPDLSQGLVIVVRYPRAVGLRPDQRAATGDESTIEYNTPVKWGMVRITAVRGETVFLRAENGKRLSFDLEGRTFRRLA